MLKKLLSSILSVCIAFPGNMLIAQETTEEVSDPRVVNFSSEIFNMLPNEDSEESGNVDNTVSNESNNIIISRRQLLRQFLLATWKISQWMNNHFKYNKNVGFKGIDPIFYYAFVKPFEDCTLDSVNPKNISDEVKNSEEALAKYIEAKLSKEIQQPSVISATGIGSNSPVLSISIGTGSSKTICTVKPYNIASNKVDLPTSPAIKETLQTLNPIYVLSRTVESGFSGAEADNWLMWIDYLKKYENLIINTLVEDSDKKRESKLTVSKSSRDWLVSRSTILMIDNLFANSHLKNLFISKYNSAHASYTFTPCESNKYCFKEGTLSNEILTQLKASYDFLTAEEQEKNAKDSKKHSIRSYYISLLKDAYANLKQEKFSAERLGIESLDITKINDEKVKQLVKEVTGDGKIDNDQWNRALEELNDAQINEDSKRNKAAFMLQQEILKYVEVLLNQSSTEAGLINLDEGVYNALINDEAIMSTFSTIMDLDMREALGNIKGHQQKYIKDFTNNLQTIFPIFLGELIYENLQFTYTDRDNDYWKIVSTDSTDSDFFTKVVRSLLIDTVRKTLSDMIGPSFSEFFEVSAKSQKLIKAISDFVDRNTQDIEDYNKYPKKEEDNEEFSDLSKSYQDQRAYYNISIWQNIRHDMLKASDGKKEQQVILSNKESKISQTKKISVENKETGVPEEHSIQINKDYDFLPWYAFGEDSHVLDSIKQKITIGGAEKTVFMDPNNKDREDYTILVTGLQNIFSIMNTVDLRSKDKKEFWKYYQKSLREEGLEVTDLQTQAMSRLLFAKVEEVLFGNS